jgi:hypothetical protein
LNDSTRGVSCAITETNVEQDHDLGSAGRGLGYDSGVHFCAIVHPRQCTDSKGVPARVLRE